MYCPYSAQIPLPCLQIYQHHNPSISPQLLYFLVTHCQVTCIVECTILLCPVRQNVGIVKTDPTPLWDLRDSKDWFILCSEPTLLNAIRKSPSQHNDWVWKEARMSDVDNKGSVQLKTWGLEKEREDLVVREMFVRHRWETGEIVKGSQSWQVDNRGQRTGRTGKNLVTARIASRVKQGLGLPGWDLNLTIRSGGTCVSSEVLWPMQVVTWQSL